MCNDSCTTGHVRPAIYMNFVWQTFAASLQANSSEPTGGICSCICVLCISSERICVHYTKRSAFSSKYCAVIQTSRNYQQCYLKQITLRQSLSLYTAAHLEQLEIMQGAQLPRRSSASAALVYLDWLTDRAMHRTPQNRRCCITSYMYTQIVSTVSAKKASDTRGRWSFLTLYIPTYICQGHLSVCH